MQHLDPTEVVHVVELLQDGTSIHAIDRTFTVSPIPVVSAWRKFQNFQAVTLGKLDRTIEGP